MVSSHLVDARTLKGWLSDGDEIALVDVREAGSFTNGHPFLAVSVPYSVFELRIGGVVPNRHVRLVICDDGTEVAHRARRRAAGLGYSNVFVLDGGTPAWAKAGYTLFSGVNVPSKTFGELVEHVRGTPHVTADEFVAMRKRGDNLVVVDGRTFGEFRRFAIPGGISCPNGELALGIDGLAPDPETTIVVNCAGRTRSIIGAQTLIDLGLANPVVALENGTQGWVLAGYDLETGARRRCLTAEVEGLDQRRAHLRRHAERRGVRFVGVEEVSAWLKDESRTTYLFDIRAEQPDGARPFGVLVHAPGGQLIQACDEWVGVRHARVVVCDDELVRAPVTASWLSEFGLEAHVLAGGVAAALDLPPRERPGLQPAALATIGVSELRGLIERGEVQIIDLRASAAFRENHISGARWSIRPVVARAVQDRGRAVVLVADKPGIAELAAIDLAESGVADIRIISQPCDAWQAAGLECAATTVEPPDQERIDFVSFTHGRHEGNLDASRQYLDWELGLIGQLDDQERAVFRILAG